MKPRNPALNALAVVVFLFLIFVGIAIAIYSSRYVPLAINSFSSRNPITSLPTSGFPGGQTSQTPSSVIPSSVQQQVVANPSAPGSLGSEPVLPQVQQVPQYTPTPTRATASYTASAAYGLPDLATNIVAVGYLANASNASFVASPVIPVGARAAVQFTIGNVGGAPTGPWNFIAQIPTDNGYLYTSPIEQSMNPGDHILFTLAFDQVPVGSAEMINIVADPNNQIHELTKNNNTAQASVSVVGS